MGGWAPTHGARKDVAVLCDRIVVGQTDEIGLMQTWLSDRGQLVPDDLVNQIPGQLERVPAHPSDSGALCSVEWSPAR